MGALHLQAIYMFSPLLQLESCPSTALLPRLDENLSFNYVFIRGYYTYMHCTNGNGSM